MSIKSNIFEKFYLSEKITKISSKNLLNKSNEVNSSFNKSINTSETYILSDNFKESLNFAKCFSQNIIPYLSLADAINLKVANKTLDSLVNKKALKLCVISNSIKGFNSIQTRNKIWNYFLNIQKFIKELIDAYPTFKIISNNNNSDEMSQQFYNKILDEVAIIKNNQQSSYITSKDKINLIKDSIEYISKDVDRTFHTERFTKGNGKEELKRILEGVSALKENVGYCQGMNFFAGSLLQLLDSEVDSFIIFNCLFKHYELCNLFSNVSNTPFNIKILIIYIGHT